MTSSQARPASAVASFRGRILVPAVFGLFCAAAAAVVLGAPGVVVTSNGTRYEGEVVEQGLSVLVTIHGVQSRLSRADIVSIEYTSGDFKQQFADRREKLDARDVRGRIALARFALDHKAYDAAMEVLDEAVEIEPKNEEAQTMRDTVRRQQMLDQNRAAAPAGSGAAPAGNAPPPANDKPPTRPAAGDLKTVSPDDIQEIRKQELRSNDRARISIPNDVRRAFATKMGMNFSQFNGKSQIEQALAILDNGDADMQRQVKIMSDPDALVEYKRLQPMILTGCGASGCHGGSSAGNFMLLGAENEAATYTNFYILSTYVGRARGASNDGFFGGTTDRRMVERQRADQSLLVQYGLPEGKGTAHHPTVPNFNAMFRDMDDARLKRVLNWIKDGLRPQEPEYHVSYVPKHAAATRPATQPASSKPTTKPSDTKPGTRPATRPKPPVKPF